MGFSAFLVLGFMGGEIGLFLIQAFRIAIDCFTYVLLLLNFAIVGVLAVFMSKIPIFVTQSYMVIIGVLTAYWFTMLPEWTTWVLLVAMALYDLAAVLLPGGPLRLLVELAISRDEDIPALVYEARPIIDSRNNTTVQKRVWRDRRANPESQTSPQIGSETIGSSQNVEEGHVHELSVPLIERVRDHGLQPENLGLEGIGLGSLGAIKLGLGDFIFYSVLVGRAAMYDFMTVYACYLAIIAGLGITLILLALYQKALPALPVSVILGVLFYVLTRIYQPSDIGCSDDSNQTSEDLEPQTMVFTGPGNCSFASNDPLFSIHTSFCHLDSFSPEYSVCHMTSNLWMEKLLECKRNIIKNQAFLMNPHIKKMKEIKFLQLAEAAVQTIVFPM
ncbi:hypothetical protein R6Q59_034220 [Mikania micrantha]